MVILLWSGLNIIAGLGILYLIFRAAQLLKKRIGWGAALLFGFVLFTVGRSKTGSQPVAPPTQNLLRDIPKGTSLGNGNSSQHISLGFNTVYFLAEYRNEQGLVKARGLFAAVSGFTLGHIWQPVAGALMQQGPQLYYTAELLHQWRLLGVPVYSSQELYKGVMPINHL